MIRAFIAITPSEALRQAFREVRAVLQGQTLLLRWVKLEHVHLTLQFLGNVLPEQIAHIGRAMDRAVVGEAPFVLLAQGLGCFPNRSRPRILWMGLEPHHTLLQLQQRLAAELTPLGFTPEDRPWHPHLTLARMQQGVSRSQLEPLLRAYHDRPFGEMPVEQLCLFQSQLHQEGVVYTMLHVVVLRG